MQFERQIPSCESYHFPGWEPRSLQVTLATLTVMANDAALCGNKKASGAATASTMAGGAATL